MAVSLHWTARSPAVDGLSDGIERAVSRPGRRAVRRKTVSCKRSLTLSVTLFEALYLKKYRGEMFQILHSGRYIPKLQRIKFWCPSLKYDRHQIFLFRVEI